MTLTQLRYLVAIADADLNITQAADRVYATQPGLSKHLKQLEAELGCQLFSRKGKSLDAITPAGRLVLERARHIVSEAADIRTMSANLRGEKGGELRIVTTHTQARFVLPHVVAQLKRHYPDVSVHVLPGNDEQVLERLQSGEADLGVTSTADAPPAVGLALPAYRWQRVILVPRDHALAATGASPSLTQLAAYPLVSYDSSIRPDSSLRRTFLAQGLTPQIAFTAGDADLIKTYVRAGLGVGVLAEMAIRREDEADLAVLPGQSLFPTCTTWILLRRDRIARLYALDFIKLFAPQLGRHDVERALADSEACPVWPEPPAWPAPWTR